MIVSLVADQIEIPPPPKKRLLVPTERQIKYKTMSINKLLAEYNQKDVTFHNLFISVRRSTCFRRFSVHHQELKTEHTGSGICQTVTATCC